MVRPPHRALCASVGQSKTALLVRDDLGILEVSASNTMGLPEARRLAIKWHVPHDQISYDCLGLGNDFPNFPARGWADRKQETKRYAAKPSDTAKPHDARGQGRCAPLMEAGDSIANSSPSADRNRASKTAPWHYSSATEAWKSWLFGVCPSCARDCRPRRTGQAGRPPNSERAT
jgi:hypothetical protein